MGLALGLTAGGLLLTIGSWPWIFWFNLPVVAGCLIAAVPALRFSAGPPTPFNLSGSVLASATVVAVVLVGTELARPAPSGRIVTAAFATSFTAFALFVATQRRAARPLVTPALLRVRTLPVACAVAALYMASFGAEFFLVTLYLQEQRGYTALAAGLAFLPLAATIVVGNTVAGRVASRWSLWRLLSAAYFIGAVGLAILGLAAATSGSYADALLPGLLISGLGQGMAFTGMFITGTRDLPPESSGTGSALVTTAQYTGGSIGLAALVLIQGQQPDAQTYAVAFTITAAVALTAIPIVVTVLRAEEGAPVHTT